MIKAIMNIATWQNLKRFVFVALSSTSINNNLRAFDYSNLITRTLIFLKWSILIQKHKQLVEVSELLSCTFILVLALFALIC